MKSSPQIGAGGMVYKATDTNLKRAVAIKVLPASVAGDAERLARFQREAEVLAALNHPNIAQIHGLERSDGITALVMELVEGPTLADRIAQGAIPIGEALPIAKQIAEALEAAHELGIIHRDLKPANIKVRADGTVKVLDFGLAKAMEPTGAARVDATNSPTLSIMATQAGVIFGTAAYMSPEQAVGKPTDRRADIFSFGVVLYEMLCGRPAFSGDSVGEILAAVVKDEPDRSALPPATPLHVRALLQRCLIKDRRQRLQAIGEARLILDNPPAQSERARLSSRMPWVAAAGIVAIAAVAFAALGFVRFRETPPVAPLLNTTITPPDGAAFDFQSLGLPVLSPDGSRIVFGASPKDGKPQLWVRRLDSATAQPLPGTEGATFPFWSTDSRWVGFGQARALKKIDTQGGPAVTLTELAADFRGGSWNPDGVIVFAENQGINSMKKVSAAGGTAVAATTIEKGKETGGHRYPWFLPDGRHFLYTSQQPDDIVLFVGSLDESDKPGKRVAQAHSHAIYSQGHLLYLRENTLMAQPFDADRLVTAGEARPIAEQVPTFTVPSRAAAFTASATGLLVYQTAGFPGESRLVWRDRKGAVLGNLGEPKGYMNDIGLSPDRRLLALVNQERNGGQADIWIYDTVRGIPTRFTFDPARTACRPGGLLSGRFRE